MQDMRDNYHGAMADLDALVDEFYRVCPDNKFLRANYPRDESAAVTSDRDQLAHAELINKAATLISWFVQSPSFTGWKHPQQAQWWDDIQEACGWRCRMCGDYDCNTMYCR